MIGMVGIKHLLLVGLFVVTASVFADQYSDSGIVVSPRAWDEFDYLGVRDLLVGGDVDLPKISGSSSYVFSKIIDKKNLAIFSSKDVSIEEKVYFGMEVEKILTELSLLYITAHISREGNYEKEVAYLTTFNIEVMAEAKKTFLLEIKANRREDYIRGKREILEGQKMVVLSLITLISRRDIFHKESLNVLSNSLKRNIVLLTSDLDAGSKAKIKSAMNNLKTLVKHKSVRQNVVRSISLMNGK